MINFNNLKTKLKSIIDGSFDDIKFALELSNNKNFAIIPLCQTNQKLSYLDYAQNINGPFFAKGKTIKLAVANLHRKINFFIKKERKLFSYD